MKIAINTRLLLKDQMEGIGWYTHELTRRMVLNHPEHDFYFIFDRTYDQSFIYAKNVHPVIVSPPARHVFLYYVWFDFALKRALKKIKPDLFFSPDSINSIKPICKTITTVHDVNFIKNPKNFDFLLRHFYSRRTAQIVKSSNKIVTVSEFSKNDIMKLLKVPEEKIDVVYNACREGFSPIDDIEKTKIKSKYTNGKDYFVFIGGLYHRKNLVRLIEAFEIFKESTKSELKLLIVGRKVGEANHLIKKVEDSKYKMDIILTGRIDDDVEVKKILASALALTYVSVLEGFGMPLVEAMKSGIPIIASNEGSIPEVGGNAVLYVNALDINDIAVKMEEIYTNLELRNQLLIESENQVKKFNWDESARKLWSIFEETIKTG